MTGSLEQARSLIFRALGVYRFNKWVGKTYIPHPRELLYVETSSICNLRCKICAYSKKSGPRMTMDHRLFCDVIDQATGLGYDTFGLSPLTGDVFAGEDFLAKLEHLEKHARVAGYSFYTNFTLADDEAIDRLLAMRKLRNLNVSLYGHDRESFIAITRSTDQTYDWLVHNLQQLADKADRIGFNLEFGWRTFSSVGSPWTVDSELGRAVSAIRQITSCPVDAIQSYNNWGGFVSQDDVAGLDMRIMDGTRLFKTGPCIFLFYKNIVLADGRVNACGCGDVNTTLVIGDLATQPLRDILSVRNQRYMQLIEAQKRGHFQPVCRACFMYRSIYRQTSYPRHHKKQVSLREFYQVLGG